MAERALVVLPTYNERATSRRSYRQILEQDHRIEVLIVDDNSPDGTGQIADELAGANPRVHVLHRSEKEGLGKAYLAGFSWALDRGLRLLFEMDADFTHDPKFLGQLLAAAGRRSRRSGRDTGRGQRDQLADLAAAAVHRRQSVRPIDHGPPAHRLDRAGSSASAGQCSRR